MNRASNVNGTPGGFCFLEQEARVVPIDSVRPHPQNVNKANLDAIRESVRANGFYGFIVVQKSTGYVCAGNHRFLLAKEEGATHIPVTFIDVDDQTALRILLADNRTTRLGVDDSDALADLLQAIQDEQGSLVGTGFDDSALQDLLKELGRESRSGLTDEDATVPLPLTPISALGDLWLPGPHRIVCGDSTDQQTVSRVFGSVNPTLLITDQPYGVQYDPEWRKRAGVNNSNRMGKVRNDDRSDWRDAWALFPGDVAYVWHGALHASTVSDSLESCGFEIRSQIVWAKPSLVMGRGHYHWQHEPCWYAVRGTGHWNGDRKQSTLWPIENRNQDAETIHSTQKPVECMRRPILNNSKANDYIYDPFCGSGTTIIAAETESRVALAIELEPSYVDVAVIRWQNFTGKQAVLEGDGRTFHEIAIARAKA
jgi:DNA modification methylase